MKIMGDRLTRVLVGIKCNKCGRKCTLHAFAVLEARWLYRSHKDTEHHQAHFCEPCYDWLKKLLEENGVKIDVAEGDAWDGESLLDVGENETPQPA